MYIRFVINELDEDSSQRKGLFQAIGCMKDRDVFYNYELDYITGIMEWFDKNLESPLEHLNKKKSKNSEVYISWFIESASEHIAKIREFVFLLESKGVLVEQIRTDSPGKIVYEDKYQVFAKPFTHF